MIVAWTGVGLSRAWAGKQHWARCSSARARSSPDLPDRTRSARATASAAVAEAYGAAVCPRRSRPARRSQEITMADERDDGKISRRDLLRESLWYAGLI